MSESKKELDCQGGRRKTGNHIGQEFTKDSISWSKECSAVPNAACSSVKMRTKN